MLQLGIIGVGRIGRVHIRGILSGVPGAHIRGIAAPHITEEIEQLARSAGAEILTQDHRRPAAGFPHRRGADLLPHQHSRGYLRGGPAGGKACVL